MILRTFCVLAAMAASATAIAADQPNMLTHGMVQMTIQVGQTSQSEILETFGAPNITTIDAQGNEVWVYDRHATVSSSKSSSFSIGMLVGAGGGGVAGGAGTGFGKGKSRTETGSRSMTLIIKFDSAKRVSDFKSRSSSF